MEAKIAPDEIGLVEKKAKVSKEIATGIIRVGAELRRQYKANELPYGPSVGDLVNWALLVADGVAPEVAAEETVIAMTSDNAEVQDTVRRVVRMIFTGAASKGATRERKICTSSRTEGDVRRTHCSESCREAKIHLVSFGQRRFRFQFWR